MKLKIIICLALYANAYASAPAQKMNLNNKRPASDELERQENSKKPKNDSSIPASLKTAANEQKHVSFAALMHNKRAAAKQDDYKNMQQLFPVPREFPYLAQTMILPFLHSTTPAKLWAKSLEPIALEESDRAVKAIFSKDGKRIITVTNCPSCSCNVWNAHTGKKITTIPHYGICLAASNTQGTRVATKDYTGKILLWDVETNQLLHSLEDDTKELNGWQYTQDLQFSKDDTTLLNINEKGIINRWNTQYGIPMQALKIDTSNLICLSSFNADGSKAVVSFMTEKYTWPAKKSYIIDTATTQVISQLPVSTKKTIFSPDSTLVATQETYHNWKTGMWHTNTGTLIKEINTIWRMDCGSISSDNKLILARGCSLDDSFQLIDTSNWQTIYVSEGKGFTKDAITSLLLSPDDTSIFVSRQDGTANILKPNAAWEKKKLSWEHKKLTVDQIMLVWLIEQYHPKLIKHNPKHKDKVLKLISYFLSIDHAYLQTIFKSFTPEQQKDLHELYDIVLQ